MVHKWRDIRHKLSPEAEAEIRRNVQLAPLIMRLYELRESRNVTQTSLAETLDVNQGAVSKMERRGDMYVSTLRSYLKALGAELQIRAIFPDGEVVIEQFEDLDADSSDPAA